MDVCVQVQRLTYLFTCLTDGRATLASKFEKPRPWTLYILQSNTCSAGMESGRLVTRIFQSQTIRNTNYDIPLPHMHHSKQTIAALSHRNTINAACCSQPPHWLPEYVKNFKYPHYQLQNKNTTSAHRVHLCVLRGAQNKERLFPYTILTDSECVHCTVITESLTFRHRASSTWYRRFATLQRTLFFIYI